MTKEEALRFANKEIMAVLLKAAQDPKELPAIQQRLFLYLTERNKKITDEPVPFYFPPDKRMFLITGWDKETRTPRITVFVPAFVDAKKKRPERFAIEVKKVFSHEIIHYQHMNEFPSWNVVPLTQREFAQSEGVAWGTEILEITRPLVQRGVPMLPFEQWDSDALRLCGDDIRSECWYRRYLNYPR